MENLEGGSGIGVTQAPVTLTDALRALTAVNQDIVLLDYGNVVIRRGYQDLKTVRLLGGGMCGTDLIQAICVGRGMLTASILGEDTAPSSRQILRTIKELNQGENCGIFVIVQANSDSFNFALAVERANSDCRTRVKLLTINDYKNDDENTDRYSCGFILLTKILGAMAEQGVFFDDIYRCYTDIVDHIVTLPLHYMDNELGPKRKSITLTNDFEEEFRTILDKKSQFNLHLHPGIPTVALINTSRTLDRLMELGLVKQVIDKLRRWGVCLVRLYYGSFITTSVGTAYLTIMKVFDMKIIEYLDAQSDAGWHQVTQFLPEITLDNQIRGVLKPCGKQEVPNKGAKLDEIQSKICTKAIEFACEALISCERQLNIIDEEKSDGNVGTRLKNMSENVLKRLNNHKLPFNCPYALLKKLGIIAESAMGGTMGSIYGVLFEGAANVFEDLPEHETVTPFIWANAFSFAANSIKQYSGDKNDENMYYPIRCAEIAICKDIENEQHFLQCFGLGVSAAEEAALRTKLPNNKHPDAGAHAVGIWMRAVFEAVKIMSMQSLCDS